jgi:hypothetical protein
MAIPIVGTTEIKVGQQIYYLTAFGRGRWVTVREIDHERTAFIVEAGQQADFLRTTVFDGGVNSQGFPIVQWMEPLDIVPIPKDKAYTYLAKIYPILREMLNT